MYAVVRSGGKQFRVKEGEFFKVESLPSEVGSRIHFEKVLFISADGKEYFNDADKLSTDLVEAEILRHGRGDKIRIIKYKRRKHQMKWQGHRQNFTEVQIKSIRAPK